jgi:hypothetical protein
MDFFNALIAEYKKITGIEINTDRIRNMKLTEALITIMYVNTDPELKNQKQEDTENSVRMLKWFI